MATEKRLIDANALQRRICGAKCGCEYEDCGCEGDCIFDCFISNAPTVDAVEVVRCKDCIHHIYVDMGDDIGEIGGCELLGCAMPYDAFCSYGERRTDEKAD